MTDTAPSLEGITWTSRLYVPDSALDGYIGPDQHNRCESPRHPFGEFKPPAEWVEMLWHPETKTVHRCWKTCEECHVAMAASAERSQES